MERVPTSVFCGIVTFVSAGSGRCGVAVEAVILSSVVCSVGHVVHCLEISAGCDGCRSWRESQPLAIS